MSDVPKLTKEQAAIICAYTGIVCGDIADVRRYAERVLGRPMYTHHFADSAVWAALLIASKADFEAISCEDTSSDMLSERGCE
jgi:hypothetical protein